MTSIPWGWQLLVSFAVPIISALGAYLVAWMTARRADRRRDKDQEAEENRRQQDRDDRERERRDQLRRESNARQRRAVAELSSTFKRAWDQAVGEKTAATLGGETALEISMRKSNAVTQFYREVTHAVVLLELELDNQEVLEHLLSLRNIVSNQYNGLIELKKSRHKFDPMQYLTSIADYPLMTQDIQNQQMVLEITASKVLRD